MPNPAPHCPTCERLGRVVPTRTLDRLVIARERAVLQASPVSLCETPDCPVAYFDAATGVVGQHGLCVPIFQKESSEQRPVCYCFDHCVADVRAAARPDGSNRIVDDIMDACRRGLDRCHETNPQGRCCLGNVRALLRDEPRRAETCPSCRK